jgi:hypothetical protein
MVLFHEDDLRIKEMERQQETKLRRRLRRVFRVSLVILALFGLSLLALNAVGGRGDALKQGAQDFLRQISGMEPSIGRFDGVTFFPSVSGNMGDIVLKAGEEKIRIGGLKFSIGFWDVMFSTGRIRDFEITDARAAPGLYTAQAVTLDRIWIDRDAKSPRLARLTAQGKYGNDPFTVTLGLEARARGEGTFIFSRPWESAFHGESPFLNFDGVLSRQGGKMRFDFSSIGTPDKTLEGSVSIGKGKGGAMLSADLKSAGDRDTAVSGLQKTYCALAVPGKPLIPGLSLGDIMIDGAPAVFLSCPAEKAP